MSAVGGITFFSVRGAPDLPGEKLEVLQRNNVDGVAFRKTGVRAEEFILTVKVDLLLAVNVANSMVAQKALEGTLVNFTDDLGLTYTGYVCLRVDIFEPVRVMTSSGGLLGSSAGYWLESRYTMLYPGS